MDRSRGGDALANPNAAPESRLLVNRIGVWTSYLVELSPEDMACAFAAKGWRHLELSDEHARALLERGDPSSAGRRFREFASGHGVGFPQGHLWLHVDVTADNHNETIDALRRWLDLFLALEIRAAVIHPGGNDLKKAGVDPEIIMARRVRAFRALTAHVRGTPLRLCLENTPAANSVDELLAILEAVGGPHLAICLDTGHLHMADGDQPDFIRRAGALLQALHIADNEGQSDQHLMPYGRGTIRWPPLISALKEIGYDGLFNLEIPGENRCPMPVRLAKLDYIKTMVGMMLDGLDDSVSPKGRPPIAKESDR